MRIAFVVNDADTGGAQTLIEGLSRAFAASDEVHVIVLLGRGALSDRLEQAAHHVHHLGIEKRSVGALDAVRRLRALLRRIAPDVVHSHLLQADLLTIFTSPRNAALVSTLHTTGMTTSDPLRSRMIGLLAGWFARVRTQRVVACGAGALAYGFRYGYPRTRLSTVDNGTELPEAAVAGRSKAGSILTLARWHPMKDYPNLLRAFKATLSAHPEAVLTCAGSGTNWDNQELTRLIEEEQIPRRSLKLLGVTTEPRVIIAEADVLVIASSYGEALPMAGIEALAVGTPVVSTDLGDCGRLTMKPEFLVPPRDPEALGRALTRVLSGSEAEYRSLQAAGREAATRHFDIAKCAAAYYALYLDARDELGRRRRMSVLR
ncbi:glycosyltransferase [Curtobacterium sp. 9128]|uniref:glycosyltransferase n=1 Tax=Curtobacterium sp. 9128 TaxID=1793722 RepID=UPI0011A76CD0|nr:glycosyltransferase [Curtobacterium sp. 9128]